MIGLLYALVVFSDTGQQLHVDPRPLTYAECRFLRNREISFYYYLRDELEVVVLCIRE